MRILLILIAFAMLGWLYWALSGGTEFEPATLAGSAPPEAVEPEESGLPEAAQNPEIAAILEAAEADAGIAPADEVAVPEPPPEAAPPAVAEPAVADPPPALPEEPAEPLAPSDALAAIAPDLADTPAPPADEATVEASSANAAPDLRRVTGNRVNMREGPGTGFPVVSQTSAGEVVEALETDGTWLRVRKGDGTEGWMSGAYLAPADG